MKSAKIKDVGIQKVNQEKWMLHYNRGEIFKKQGKYAEATVEYIKSIKLNEYWVSYKNLGWCLFSQKNYSKAIDSFNKAILLNEDWSSYQGLGWTLVNTANYSEAIKALKKSIHLKEDWLSYFYLGFTYQRIKNYSEAIKDLNKSIALQKHWKTYQGLGWALHAIQNYGEAIEVFKKSIALKEDWNSYLGLGCAHISNGNYPEAVEALNMSNEMSIKDNPNTNRLLGHAHLQNCDYSASIKALNVSITLEESSASYLELGNALAHMKHYRKALDATVSSFVMAPSNNALKQFSKIYSLAANEKKIDKKLETFFNVDTPPSRITKDYITKKQALLKTYILGAVSLQKIDPLLLRQISLLTKQKETAKRMHGNDEILEGLKESYFSTGNIPPIMPEFHKYVFGVSHSRLYIGSPNTTVIECGAGTMFSIGDSNSRTKHYQTITTAIETINPKNSILIFEFGEVDIRNHIFKISKRKSKSFIDIANTSISRYVNFLTILKSKGFNIMISGPHCGGGPNISRISSVERNDLCSYVNDALRLECQAKGFYFFTLFDKVVDQKTLKEIPCLYSDNHHLSLPPSKTGNLLNSLLNQRINKAINQNDLPFTLFQKEELSAECNIVFSDIPGWSTGMRFEPGKSITSTQSSLQIGEYLAIIELPFLVYPKEIILEFKEPWINNIETGVQRVQDTWDISNDFSANNITDAYDNTNKIFGKTNLCIHGFNSPQSVEEEMCRFFIVKLFNSNYGNCLKSIKIKRWLHTI